MTTINTIHVTDTLKQTERLHQLDGLRAMAASFVVLFHLGLYAVGDALTDKGLHILGTLIREGSASGVEMFFTLSGVVLTIPYLRRNRSIIPSQYFIRRIQRLWPPFFIAWLLMGAVIAITTNYPTWWTQTSRLSHFDLLSWFSQIGIIYYGKNSFNGAWWSLSVEVSFYIILPLLIILLRKLRPTLAWTTLLFVGSIAISQISYNILGVNHTPEQRTMWGLFLYANCFAGGIFLGWRDFPRWWGLSVLILGIVYLLLAIYVKLLNTHIAYGLIYTGLISIALQPGILKKILSMPILVWLGERSYSWFLTHYAAIYILGHIGSYLFQTKNAKYFLFTRLIAFPLSLLIAMMLFKFVECRFAKGLTTANAFWPWQVYQQNKSEHKH